MLSFQPISERFEIGKSLREKAPRESHAEWKPHTKRRHPVDILIESSKGRLPNLLPIRYGRMVQSPFTFFRGAAAVMAADLAHTPNSGLELQLCGDCHLLNFGTFATPERRVIFDLNDFDETLPGPWEWDLKRLVASFIIASRSNGFSKRDARESALACARSYRKRMVEFAEMTALEVWYASLDMDTIMAMSENKESVQRIKKRLAKAANRHVLEDDFPKMAESKHGKHRIRDNPPLIFHPSRSEEEEFQKNLKQTYENYIESTTDDRRVLLKRYKICDLALKVVGVGSVGTRCGILLMMASERDPLFLQVKEARQSVLEPYLGKSVYKNHGQRVVAGQRLMQAASDIFLGWTQGENGIKYYIRQLRDMKLKPLVEIFSPYEMRRYGKFCGWALARAHARSGDAAKISGYLGKSEVMEEVLAEFAERYADQNELDHKSLVEAVRKGKVEVYIE